MVFGGIGMCIAAGGLYYKNRKENSGKLDITKVTPKGGNTEKSWPTMNISTIHAATVPANLDKN